jgi:hypothetical protein
MNEKIAKYDQNRQNRILGNLKNFDPWHFLIDQSGGVHI